MTNKRIIVALDTDEFNKTVSLVKKIKDEVFAFKIGYEFFFNFGIDGYKKIKKISPNIFLDLKLHDIPNTVKKGIGAIERLKPLLTTIHISGGDEMMKASLTSNKKMKILGVSILTSLNSYQAKKIYNNGKINFLVKKFVSQAIKNNLDGIVCSPREISLIRKEFGKNFLIVTPGIRINKKKVTSDDQARVMSPSKAISLGADLLVIGRPITQSNNPLHVIKEINKSLL